MKTLKKMPNDEKRVFFLRVDSTDPELGGPFESISEAEEFNRRLWDESDVELYEARLIARGASTAKFKWTMEEE